MARFGVENVVAEVVGLNLEDGADIENLAVVEIDVEFADL